jgi:hypothetical protein
VTIVLPRRCYPAVAGRVLHDRTADRIARAVSHIPDAAATIIPFDVGHHVAPPALSPVTGMSAEPETHPAAGGAGSRGHERPVPPPGTDPIGALTEPRHATVQGRLQTARIQPAGQGTMLHWRIADATGDLTALFYGRTSIAGAEPGSQIRLHGMVGIGSDGQPAMINPGYELVR